MADPTQLALLKKGVKTWNRWRDENREQAIDLKGANLSGANLAGVDLAGTDLASACLNGVNLHEANLTKANLTNAYLFSADLSEVDLTEAYLTRAFLNDASLTGAYLARAELIKVSLAGADLLWADLTEANLTEANLATANLTEANLTRANLTKANLAWTDFDLANLTKANLSSARLLGANFTRASFNQADLSHANLTRSIFISTDLSGANLSDSRIYGISAWDIITSPATIQENLIISPGDKPAISVGDLEVAQFLYLLLNNQKLRNVLQTITSKVVLILGRFCPERKPVLDGLRQRLSRGGRYVPVMFDFPTLPNRNVTETVQTLAHLSRFVIVDITDPKSAPQELQAIVPALPSVPIQPILQHNAGEYSMFDDYRDRPNVLQEYRYTSLDMLLDDLETAIIAPAEAMADMIIRKRVTREQ